MKSLVIGGSAGLGRQLADRLAERGDDLVLVASDARDLEPVAADLRARHGSSVTTIVQDLGGPDAATLKVRIVEVAGVPDYVFYVAGLGHLDDTGNLPQTDIDRLIDVNFRSALSLLNAFFPDMDQGAIRTVVCVGSVASARGRGTNMVYAAAKRGLAFYAEALRHRLASSSCCVQTYLVGFMDTTMLDGRAPKLPPVAPEEIARRIVRNLDRDIGAVYVPAWWLLATTILRLLPWWIFKRVNL